jgi:hypothetical protein
VRYPPDSRLSGRSIGSANAFVRTQVEGSAAGRLDALVGGEAEADVIGGPLAFAVADFWAQDFSDFSDIGRSAGGRQGCGEAFSEGFQPAGDITGEWSWAGYQAI